MFIQLRSQSNLSWAAAMRSRSAMCLLLGFLVAAPALATEAGSIPGDVTHVAAGRAEFNGNWSDFRLVITGSCSPEHCFSRGRIEWVDGSIPGESTVTKTMPVEELESVLLVRSVAFHPMHKSEPASFSIRAVNTYTEQGATLVLSITGVGSYRATVLGNPLGPPAE
jgi:hypothetical protein